MNKEGNKMTDKEILDRLDSAEKHLRQSLKNDEGDIEELKSEWQERDSASERNLRSVEWHQYSSLQNQLVETIDAKRKLDEGSYGTCEDCGTEINAKRLMAVPTARRCIACQDKYDKSKGTVKSATL